MALTKLTAEFLELIYEYDHKLETATFESLDIQIVAGYLYIYNFRIGG